MRVPPPPPAPVDPVVDTLHGVEVADPYRWLEDGERPDTRTWVDAQNQRTRTALDGLTDRPILRQRLERLLRAPVVTSPRVAGTKLFTLERGGDRDQAVLVVRSAIDRTAPARTLVDPGAGAADAAVAIDWFHPSPDGALVAYGTSEAGDERSTLRILDTGTGAHRGDVIAHTRSASVAWLADGSAFAYTRYPDPAAAGEDEAGYHRSVWWHVLGDDPGHDELVWGDADLPDRTAWPGVSMSPDGRWLLVHVALGWSRTDVHLIDRTTGERTVVIEGQQALTSLRVVGDRLYGTTTLGAPRGRVVGASVAAPRAASWETLVAESEAVIEGATVAGDSLLIASTKVGVAHLDRYRLDGAGEAEVALPGIGSLAGLDADHDEERAFLAFSSFARPPGLLRWTPAGLEEWGDAFDGGTRPGDYRVDQVTYASADGTQVPMFLVRRSETRPTPATPALLTGYGGFAVTNGPAWSPMAVAVADAGGIYAVAGIRGGSEHGEDWHRAGMRANKQRSFDDFLAAADWLVTEGLTSRSRLAIRGGSNGGLLMGAALTQRPEVCRAVHCAVPLLDMVRFHRFLIAELWVPEYGDPRCADDFTWLHALSPYHRVVDDTCYPAVLLTTADSDSRVDPCHARKFAARLQAATSCGDRHPVLLRVEGRAGHGQGKPVHKQADEAADVLAFVFDQLGVQVQAGG
jgi:prolyl oligopeptidase